MEHESWVRNEREREKRQAAETLAQRSADLVEAAGGLAAEREEPLLHGRERARARPRRRHFPAAAPVN